MLQYDGHHVQSLMHPERCNMSWWHLNSKAWELSNGSNWTWSLSHVQAATASHATQVNSPNALRLVTQIHGMMLVL